MSDVPPPSGPLGDPAGAGPSTPSGPASFGQAAPPPFGQAAPPFGQTPPPPSFGQAAPPYGQAAPPPYGQATSPPGWGTSAGGMYPPGGWVPPPVERRSGMALASFILGLVGVVTCFLFVPSILAIIFGFVGLATIRREAPALTGRKFAIWGIVLGFLGLAIIGGVFAADSAGLLDDDEASFNEIEVGDCVMLPDDIGGEVRGIELADCADPHDGEVFAIGDLDPEGDRAFPGADTVTLEVQTACFDAFEPFVGRGYSESALDVVVFRPLEMSWLFDTGYVCVVNDPSGASLVGSVKGSGR
jgi:hypothetical protein